MKDIHVGDRVYPYPLLAEKTMERLYASMQNAREDSLLVQKGYGGRIILKDEIVFCEIIDRKIYLNLASGEVVDYYERIENLETKLDNRFYRCHRSYLINLKHLKGYKNGAAHMDNGKEIPVSRLRFYYDTAGIAAMLVSEAASLLLTGVCYYMVYRYFFRGWKTSLLYRIGDAANVSGFHSDPDDLYYE